MSPLILLRIDMYNLKGSERAIIRMRCGVKIHTMASPQLPCCIHTEWKMIHCFHNHEKPEPIRCLRGEEAVFIRCQIPLPDIGQERGAKNGWVERVEVHHCERSVWRLELSIVQARIYSIEEIWNYR